MAPLGEIERVTGLMTQSATANTVCAIGVREGTGFHPGNSGQADRTICRRRELAFYGQRRWRPLRLHSLRPALLERLIRGVELNTIGSYDALTRGDGKGVREGLSSRDRQHPDQSASSRFLNPISRRSYNGGVCASRVLGGHPVGRRAW